MKKFMIIDESNEVAVGIANILSQYLDFTLSGVHFTAAEALRYLKVENPEIIFINVLLSGMTGIKLTDKIKGYNPRTKVVLMSEDKRFRIDGYEAGADGFLLKPIKSEDVLGIIHNIFPDDIEH